MTTSSEAAVRALERVSAWVERGNPPGGMNVPGNDGTPSIRADLRTLMSTGFAILPLPHVGEEAVERIAKSIDGFLDSEAAQWGYTTRQMAEAIALATTSPSPGAGVEWRGIEPTQAVINYVVRYGGMCRDCADEYGVCPSSGLPCEGAGKAVRHVIDALNYGHAHGYLPAPPAEPVGEGG